MLLGACNALPADLKSVLTLNGRLIIAQLSPKYTVARNCLPTKEKFFCLRKAIAYVYF